MRREDFYVYILKCHDGSTYTGITNDLRRRIIEHQEGLLKGCYTQNRRPITLLYFEHFKDPISAICREKQIKKWSRGKKLALVKGDTGLLKQLSKAHVSTSST
jgi:putative endonuclease